MKFFAQFLPHAFGGWVRVKTEGFIKPLALGMDVRGE
jgi:hypothetical protein